MVGAFSMFGSNTGHFCANFFSEAEQHGRDTRRFRREVRQEIALHICRCLGILFIKVRGAEPGPGIEQARKKEGL